MKTPIALFAALLVASQLLAETPLFAPATPTAPPAANPPAAKPVTAPAPAPAGIAKPAAPAKEKEPIIPGQTILRDNGTFLGLQVIGGNFVLSFYDKKKKPIAPDVTRVYARWPNLRSASGDNRAVLNPQGNVLVGNKPVVAPLVFNLRLAFIVGDGDDAHTVESIVVPFKG